ncbi:SGNH/GDSL hydrolase family protein [Lactobacillus corticis]|uniref:Esterase n=1 Tax=Lactobacillus corticis TaxID=2201249 RepID=A0A916QK05_9LACO|nr:SGNH/GDSL hydrolase family protein [Lactobacillus corticis]GFZ26785.1 esterase [Lactobacillus corticis]
MALIVLFGDSLFNSFRNRQDTDLVTKLFQAARPNDQIQNLSKSGATTEEGLDYAQQIPKNCDLVVFEYGTNDAATDWGLAAKRYAQNLAKLVQPYQTRAVVAGPCLPDRTNREIMQYYPQDRLGQFNHLAQQTANKFHSPYVDLLAAFAKAEPSQTYQADGQHLTDYGNQLLVKAFLPAISQILDH